MSAWTRCCSLRGRAGEVQAEEKEVELARHHLFELRLCVCVCPRTHGGVANVAHITTRQRQAPPMAPPRALAITAGHVAAIACLGCSTSLLTTLSKRHASEADAAYAYWPPVVVVTAEACKALMSLGLLKMTNKKGDDKEGPSPNTWPPASSLPHLAGLAILYALQNNLLFAAMRIVNFATYQVLISLRIPVTAGLMWALLGRRFTRRQCSAIAALVAGVVLSQVDVGQLLAADDAGSAFSLSLTGLLYMSTTVMCASLASVLNETMLKNESRGSLHAQNCVLYACGCGVNAALLGRRGMERVADSGVVALYNGFNAYTWALVASLTFLGLATAAILKHADNMIRSLGYVGSIVLASGLSAAWLGDDLSPSFAAGGCMACVGIVAYMCAGRSTVYSSGTSPPHLLVPQPLFAQNMDALSWRCRACISSAKETNRSSAPGILPGRL